MESENSNLGALIEALTIFLEYGNPEWPINCSHDRLHVKGPSPSKMEPGDVARLGDLNFFYDENEDIGWSSFVFGSC